MIVKEIKKSKILRVKDQTLRFMRHKEGSQLYKGEILYCNQCNKKWNSNEINLLFIEHHLKNNYYKIKLTMMIILELYMKHQMILLRANQVTIP